MNIIRRVPLEVIQCRHCDKSFQTSEKHLRKALLCQECFDARKILRKDFPKVIHEKAENNLGDRYDETRTDAKTVVCAGCGQIYELISSEYIDSTVEEQKRHYDNFFAFHKGLKPFKPRVFSYKYAPKGWTNEILCKSCFDSVQVGCEDEIQQLHEIESARVKKEATIKEENELQRRKKDYEDYVSEKSFWKLMIILFLLFAIPTLLTLCNGITDSVKEAPEIYYRK